MVLVKIQAGYDGITGLALGFLAVLHTYSHIFSKFQQFLLTVVLQYYISLRSKKAKQRQGNYFSVNANHYMKLKVAQSSHTKVLSALQSLLVYTEYYHCTLTRKKNKAVTT